MKSDSNLFYYRANSDTNRVHLFKWSALTTTCTANLEFLYISFCHIFSIGRYKIGNRTNLKPHTKVAKLCLSNIYSSILMCCNVYQISIQHHTIIDSILVYRTASIHLCTKFKFHTANPIVQLYKLVPLSESLVTLLDE